ncbi:MAG: Asp-tRNA(Asn)/Glu-tRNA(Gln) amidotransferase subunit GatB [Dehalococcoidia bacterium]|nr:Asp-tRNA(Asn)/Glu-tRNA(Gln) amidotransferase subunit GatB [Dehalococcoidia bacterium]
MRAEANISTTYETIIGLEVHAQLLTRSKMYCACSADYASAPPNTHVCPVCMGMPGVLPVINREAVEYTIMTALALNCTVADFSVFDRKNYPYPDLMKGYQISQYDHPVGVKGWLTITVDGESKVIGITRVHLEEDVAKLFHRTNGCGETYSLVDINRAGVPLMEIVGEPDIRSPEEARQYLIKLRSILQYLGVSTGNMEEGSFRCDANVSIRPAGTTEYLAKVEVKNMNSFRAVYRALEYEVERQQKVLEEGGRLVQETRGWVEEKGITVSQRSKEYAHDYRYFPEPDLPPLTIGRELVESIRARLPELPDARRERFMSDYGLSIYDASLLTISRAQAEYFEESIRALPAGVDTGRKAKEIANWLLGEYARLFNVTNTDITRTRTSPQQLVDLLEFIDRGTLSTTMAKTVFEEMFHTGRSAAEIVEERGLSQISGETELEAMVDEVLSRNQPAAADFRKGKDQALKFLVGQVMKETRGRANPQVVNDLLKRKLEVSP